MFVSGLFGQQAPQRPVPEESTDPNRIVLEVTRVNLLFTVADKKGRFVDIQTYKRAHGMDIKRKGKMEKGKK